MVCCFIGNGKDISDAAVLVISKKDWLVCPANSYFVEVEGVKYMKRKISHSTFSRLSVMTLVVIMLVTMWTPAFADTVPDEDVISSDAVGVTDIEIVTDTDPETLLPPLKTLKIQQ